MSALTPPLKEEPTERGIDPSPNHLYMLEQQ